MNPRIVFGAIAAVAMAFAGYQLYLIARPQPRPAAATTPAAAPIPAAAPAAAPATEIASANELLAPGADAPFDPEVARRITAEEVKARLDKGQKVVFVDTRHEIPDVVIKGAVQVPVEKLDAWAKSVPKSAFVVTYCTCPNEETAAREVIALQKKGFRTAFALKDGLFAWQSFDLPTEQPPRPSQSPAS